MRTRKYFQEGGELAYTPNTTVTDIADVNTKKARWWNPFSWGQGNDARDLAARGFVYQDENGRLVKVNAGEWNEDQLRAAAKQAKRNELLERKYGAPSREGWSEDALNLRNTMVNSNSGIIRLGSTPVSTPTTTPAKDNTGHKYSWNITKNEYSPAYANLFKALHANGKYDILDALLDNGVITDKGLQNYLTTNNFDDMNAFATNLLQTNAITQAQYDALGIPVKQTHPTSLSALAAQTDQSHWGTNDQTQWAKYGINNQNRARAVQTAFGLTPDNWLGTGTSTALNGKTFTDNDFYNDYYIFNDGSGNNYYAGANGKVYNAQGQEVTHSYKGGKHTITTSTSFKKGGAMKYFQTGGAINRQQVNRDTNAQQREVLKAAFSAAATGDMETLSKVLGITTQDQLNQFINIATKISKQKDADPEMADLASKALNGLQQAMSVKAEKGAKLEYIKRLNGNCPEGYEMKMFKVGGKMCKKCQKIEEACGGKKLEDGGESPIVTKFKNGRKCKK